MIDRAGISWEGSTAQASISKLTLEIGAAFVSSILTLEYCKYSNLLHGRQQGRLFPNEIEVRILRNLIMESMFP
jgi:hypothetical protein